MIKMQFFSSDMNEPLLGYQEPSILGSSFPASNARASREIHALLLTFHQYPENFLVQMSDFIEGENKREKKLLSTKDWDLLIEKMDEEPRGWTRLPSLKIIQDMASQFPNCLSNLMTGLRLYHPRVYHHFLEVFYSERSLIDFLDYEHRTYSDEIILSHLDYLAKLTDELQERQFTQTNRDAMNALMIGVECRPELVPAMLNAMRSLRIETQSFILTEGKTNNALLLAAHFHPEVVAPILDQMAEFPISNQALILRKAMSSGWNALMLTTKTHLAAANLLLDRIMGLRAQDQKHIFSQIESQTRFNAFRIAISYQPSLVPRLLPIYTQLVIDELTISLEEERARVRNAFLRTSYAAPLEKVKIATSLLEALKKNDAQSGLAKVGALPKSDDPALNYFRGLTLDILRQTVQLRPQALQKALPTVTTPTI